MKIVLGFSFGHRGQEPGLSNEAIAEAIQQFKPDIISTQWEIGKALRKLDIIPEHEVLIHREKGHYLDTEEVARQMVEFIKNNDLTDKDIYLAAYRDHVTRCIKIFRKKFGIDTKPMPSEIEIPCDPKSRQIWTRSPFLFRLREAIAFPIYVFKGYY